MIRLVLFLVLFIFSTSFSFAQSLQPVDEEYVQQTLSSMTVEEKIGQVLSPLISWGVAPDTRAFDNLISLMDQYHIGTFNLAGGFDKPTVELINALQDHSKYPLAFAADMEAGLASAISGSTLFPRAMALASSGDPEFVADVARVVAKEARAMGIGINYYPVLDVNTNPKNPIINYRAFGDDPRLVAEFGNAYIQACMEKGIIPTAKHFPGHGDTSVDSHSEEVVILENEFTMHHVHLFPFQKAIDVGLPAMMIGHLSVPSLGEMDKPATLAPQITNLLLQQQMGFEGLTITDAMTMNAITSKFSDQEAVVMALNAGADMIIFPPSTSRYAEAMSKAIDDGQISMERLNNAAADVLRAKTRLGLHTNRFVDLDVVNDTLRKEEHVELAQEASHRSIILHKDESDLLPIDLTGKTVTILQVGDLGSPPFTSLGKPFVDEIERWAGDVKTLYIGGVPTEEDFVNLRHYAQESDYIFCYVLLTIAAHKNRIGLLEPQKDLVEELRGYSEKTIWTSFGSPYEIRSFPWFEQAVIACDSLFEMQRQAVRKILGQSEFVGHLPVNLDVSAVGNTARNYK